MRALSLQELLLTINYLWQVIGVDLQEINPAEIVCINDFCKENDPNDLVRATMYTSCEPCLMCLHSIYNVGIRKIVYGASIDDAISYGSGDIEIHIKQYVKEMKLDFISIQQLSRKDAVSVLSECVNYRGEL